MSGKMAVERLSKLADAVFGVVAAHLTANDLVELRLASRPV